MKSAVRLEQTSTLNLVAEMVAHLCEQATFEFGPEGLKIQALDTMRAALLELVLRKVVPCFEQPRLLVVDAKVLTKALAMYSAKAPLTLTFDDSATTLWLSQEVHDQTREFKLSLCSATCGDQFDIPSPEHGFSARFTMPAAELHRICQHLLDFGDRVSIRATVQPVTFAVQGDEVIARLVRCPLTVEVTEETSSSYSTKYLKNFTKDSLGLAETVTLSFNEQDTLYAVCHITPRGAGELRFCLAAMQA